MNYLSIKSRSSIPGRAFCVLAGAGLVLCAASFAALAQDRPSAADPGECIADKLVTELLSAEARRIGTAVERLDEAGEVERYIKVINEEPPTAGPAESLMILVHPELKVARVFLVHNGDVCERYLIGPELHEKAWTAARGIRA
jgi:hypothetical protein